MTYVPIDPDARRAVYARSQFICECCGEHEAVHVHHLTYERAGRELPEDLQHVCIVCHCAAHPYKATEIWLWEFARRSRIQNTIGTCEQETDEECREMERDKHEEQARQRERELEQEYDHPAWNLGLYAASGYCLEDVEEEERERAGRWR